MKSVCRSNFVMISKADMYLHTGEVVGSIPTAPTINSPLKSTVTGQFGESARYASKRNARGTRRKNPCEIRVLRSPPVHAADSARGAETHDSPSPCVHYVGFRDDRYLTAFRIWGGPAFIHRWWDQRARREIAEEDTVIFADGDADQPVRPFNAPDLIEQEKER